MFALSRLRTTFVGVPPTRYASSLIRVILTENIENVGSKGEELAVKRGFARNFLFPTQRGVYASDENKLKFAEFTASIDPLGERLCVAVGSYLLVSLCASD